MRANWDNTLIQNLTVGEALELLHVDEAVETVRDELFNEPVTVGELVDFVRGNGFIQSERDREITIKFTVGDLFDLFGEENIKEIIQEKTRAASYNAAYAQTVENISTQWIFLGLFIVAFALMSTIALEMIDRDKR